MGAGAGHPRDFCDGVACIYKMATNVGRIRVERQASHHNFKGQICAVI